MKYINAVVENNTRYTDSLYTYRAPDDVKVGDVVSLPFNRGNKEKRGYVFELIQNPSIDNSKIKDIYGINEYLTLTPEIISTCKWMKFRYGIKYLDAIHAFIPPGKPPKAGREKRPLESEKADPITIKSLTANQKKAIGRIFKSIESNKNDIYLIHGVTGSGKTEVYMQAIEKTLSQGKTAIMLVPEIALTKQITERFLGRFGRDKIAILHSKLTQRERFDEWQRIRSGEARIVIGARMAVFSPLENIGLIVMDEEHEQTYKADMNPKYETVDIAVKRLMYYNGVLLMGSATPSIVSYERGKEGIYKIIELPERYNSVPLPDIEIVDMREELREGNREIFSKKLREEIGETLSNGEQAILFLNRRGYSNFISCRACGNPVICDDCGISLTYHKSNNSLICHYCGKKKPVPKVCPTCSSKYIKHFGIGTEQVEEYTSREFLGAKIARLDLDTAKNRRDINRIIGDFDKGKMDILIGTQLVAKGLDFKNVGLVGVVAADMSLNIPDYRSGERTFQLITQVAGRAGRGDKKGKVIVQTYSPESLAIKYAAEYNYEGYFNGEIEFRKMMGYPPFKDLILVEFTDKSDKIAEASSREFYNYIMKENVLTLEEQIFAPKVSRRFKGDKGEAFRYYVLIKASKDSGKGSQRRNTIIGMIMDYIDVKVKDKSSTSILIDVNPYGAI